MITSSLKTCNGCGVDREHSNFYQTNKRSGDRFGLMSTCKSCMSERAKKNFLIPENKKWHADYMSAWRVKNPDKEFALQQRYRKKNKEKLRERHKAWEKKNKVYAKNYRREYFLKKKYGITQAEYDELFLKQDGRCFICHIHQFQLKKTLSVDHSHTTGLVRSLLCDTCNLVLGWSKEDIAKLQGLIRYIKRYAKN